MLYNSGLRMITGLFIALAIFHRRIHRRLGSSSDGAATPRIRANECAEPPARLGIGLVTNFLDTLGIGSFATTTSLFRLLKLVPDEEIPGTLNVGHTLPSILQAFIYIAVVAGRRGHSDSDDRSIDRRRVARRGRGREMASAVYSGGMGLALLGTAGLMLASLPQVGLMPAGGELLGLTGTKLIIAVLANAMLGALMTLGIGLYAPCMVVIFLMGMNAKSAFPIMMGSCAFLMPVGSMRFIKEKKYNLRAALGLAIGGIPGVLIAAFIVKSLPLNAMKWLVVVVVFYTAVMMLRSAIIERNRAPEEIPATNSDLLIFFVTSAHLIPGEAFQTDKRNGRGVLERSGRTTGCD